jgi:DNA sulfur modification protein DndB
MQFRGARLAKLRIDCGYGLAAALPVLLGFAQARDLYRLSYADVLNEETGLGYQRRINTQHSLDFRRYIQREGSTTIPLTFNLRPESSAAWRVEPTADGRAILVIDGDAGRVMSQVDCQHRLGNLPDLGVSLPFMTFIGLTADEEMRIFNIINGKAKGLNPSLLDFHDGRLATDLASDRPELFVALHLNNEPGSPWYRQLDLGGNAISGMTRRASLRTMQKAVKRFLQRSRILSSESPERVATITREFWAAVSTVLAEAWARPRRYLVTKGIGVYALMDIAADLWLEKPATVVADHRYFAQKLSDFADSIDWSSTGDFNGLGGESGAKAAAGHIRDVRRALQLKAVAHG